MTTKVLRVLKNILNHILRTMGRVESVVSTSRENRFTMRPMGVVSKKLIGALMTLSNMAL
jgi:hypothetical protein